MGFIMNEFNAGTTHLHINTRCDNQRNTKDLATKLNISRLATLVNLKKSIQKWYLDNYCDLNNSTILDIKKCRMHLKARGIIDDQSINSVCTEAKNDVVFYSNLLPKIRDEISNVRLALTYCLYIGDRIAYLESQRPGTKNIVQNRDIMLNDILHCEMCVVARLLRELLQCAFPKGKLSVSYLITIYPVCIYLIWLYSLLYFRRKEKVVSTSFKTQ